MQFERLFTPIIVNGMELKNRIIMSAIHSNLTPGGHVSDQFKDFYYARAEGGAGLIIIGGMRFDEYGGDYEMPNLADDAFIEENREFTDGMHGRGVKVCAQLYHGGRYVMPFQIGDREPISASATYNRLTKCTAKEMTLEDIKTVQQKWAEGAARAVKAGFDAVEIISCSGYLINQFLSSITNLRTDEYGGSLENRCRFGREVVETVRAAVGSDYPIILRLSGNEFVPGGGGLPEAIAFAQVAEKAGADLLNITGGWHETNIPQLTGDVPDAMFSYLAHEIKKAVRIPVSASNRMTDPFMDEENLALGKSDMVTMARALIADPEWPNKVKEGRIDEIRRCVGCNQGCLANGFFGMPITCILNGLAGREYLFKDAKPAAAPRNILVVGGGPAGAEFAIRAAQRGHKVTLWEKAETTGGQLPLVAAPNNRKDFNNFISYQATMLKKTGVNIVYSKCATAQDVLAGNFDAVVLASGVLPRPFTLTNNDGNIPVYRADEILSGKVIPGKNVVIIGGGAVGCELAQYLAERGAINAEQYYFLNVHKAESPEMIEQMLNSSARNVTIIEMQPRIGNGFDAGTAWPVMKELRRLKVGQHASSKVVRTGEGFVAAEKNEEGKVTEFNIPCDTVIVAVGTVPNDGLYKELEGKVAELYNIGDSSKVGKVMSAVQRAVDLASEI